MKYLYHYKVSCVVSDECKFIVFLIAKNASSTLRAIFTQDQYYGFVTKYHNLKNDQKLYKKYAFIREPIERFLSGYFEVYLRHFGQREYNKRNNIIEPLTHHFLSEEGTLITLEKFVNHIEERGFFDTHIYPQSAFLKNISIDNYFTLENISSGVQEISKNSGVVQEYKNIPVLRPRKKQGLMSSYNYNIIDLSENICNRIKNLYAADVDLYEQIRDSMIHNNKI